MTQSDSRSTQSVSATQKITKEVKGIIILELFFFRRNKIAAAKQLGRIQRMTPLRTKQHHPHQVGLLFCCPDFLEGVELM